MKTLTFTLAAAFAMLATFGANAQTMADVAAKYDEAVAKGTAKDYPAAISLFEEVVTMGETVGEEAAETVKLAKGTLPQLYFTYGGSFVQGGKFDQALPLFEKAVATAEAVGDQARADRARTWVTNSYLKLGEAPFNAGNFAEAAEIYARAHEAIPANADIANRLAEAYGKMQEYEKAYAIFDELIAAEGPTADAAKSRLGFYMMLNANELKDSKPSEAVDILSRAIAVDGNPQAYMLLLQVANGSKNYDKIIEVGESAAEAQSDAAVKSTAYSLLGMAYQQKGDKAKAIEALRKVTSGPNAPAAKATITALQAEMGN